MFYCGGGGGFFFTGIDIIKLQIHGTVGFLYHGIIEVVRCGVSNEAPISIEQQLVE